MRARWLTSVVVAATVALQAVVVSAHPDPLPAPGRPWMLAVGDSITYGWSIDPSFHGHSWAEDVRADLAAAGDPWALYSLACPGETTESYLRGGCSGRAFVPALAGRSQRDAAAGAIRQRGQWLRLIVVELGTNDYFQARIRGGNIPAQLDAAAQQLDAVITDLERLAPGVPIIVADIYDPHGRPDSWLQAVHLDDRIAEVAARHGAALADFLHTIDRPLAEPADRCQLLDCAHCDVHPTEAGQRALAAAVEAELPPPSHLTSTAHARGR